MSGTTSFHVARAVAETFRREFESAPLNSAVVEMSPTRRVDDLDTTTALVIPESIQSRRLTRGSGNARSRDVTIAVGVFKRSDKSVADAEELYDLAETIEEHLMTVPPRLDDDTAAINATWQGSEIDTERYRSQLESHGVLFVVVRVTYQVIE